MVHLSMQFESKGIKCLLCLISRVFYNYVLFWESFCLFFSVYAVMIFHHAQSAWIHQELQELQDVDMCIVGHALFII